jgi:hypothetical protein
MQALPHHSRLSGSLQEVAVCICAEGTGVSVGGSRRDKEVWCCVRSEALPVISMSRCALNVCCWFLCGPTKPAFRAADAVSAAALIWASVRWRLAPGSDGVSPAVSVLLDADAMLLRFALFGGIGPLRCIDGVWPSTDTCAEYRATAFAGLPLMDLIGRFLCAGHEGSASN